MKTIETHKAGSSVKRLWVFVRIMVLCLIAGFVGAQPRPKPAETSDNPAITLRTRVHADSIVLRWAVTPAAYWLQANQRGYILERLDFAAPGARPTRQRLTVQPIRPWSLDSMKRLLPRNDPYVAVAAQLLHGKTYQDFGKSDMMGFYKQYEEQQGKLLVATMAAEFSPAAANALALRWVDRTYKKKTYRCVYNLWINNGPNPKATDLTKIAIAEVFPARLDTLTAPAVNDVVSGDRVIRLSWYNYHRQGRFAGFYIERSTDGKTFQRLNKVPFVMARPDSADLKQAAVQADLKAADPRLVEFTDSVNVNYRRFYYRIIGIDSFGELSPVSKTLVGNGVDLTPPPAPVRVQQQVENNQRVVLKWEMPGQTPDLKGFFIGRAGTVKGPFTPLHQNPLPVSARTFTDEKPGAYFGQYYVVAALDTAGNIAYSLPVVAVIEDHTPPAAPRRPTIRVDTNGVARLTWPASREVDVVGYKVYRSYQVNNPKYGQRTSLVLPDTTLTDSLPTRTLTRSAFYKLVAVDAAGNASAFSEPVEVEIPDKVPPSTPVIRSATVENRGVRLAIIPSGSDDVTEHTLFRREPGGVWQAIYRIPGRPVNEITWIDTTLIHQQTYEYSLIARDKGGRQSGRSFAVSAQYVNLAKLGVPVPTDVRAVFNPQQKAIQVTWRTDYQDGKRRFMIYRGVAGEPPVMYRTVEQVTTFTDQQLPQSGTYTYRVQLITEERKSVPSEPVQLVYKP